MTEAAYDADDGQRLYTTTGEIGLDCTPCDLCSDSSQTPDTVFADIAGMANDACTDCSDANGRFELNLNTTLTTSDDDCFWQSDPFEICTPDISPFDVIYELNLQDDGLGNATRIQLDLLSWPSRSSLSINWESNAAGFDDCHLWDAFPLTPITNINPQSCDNQSSTAVLNATEQLAVMWYPAEAAAGLRELFSALWAWETMQGVGTPLHPSIRQTARQRNPPSLGVGDALEKRIKGWGVRRKCRRCRKLKRHMNRVGPEAILKGLDVWTDRVVDNGVEMFNLGLVRGTVTWAARGAVRREVEGACEDVFRWREQLIASLSLT